MYILKKGPRTLGLDEPIRHENHKRPVTRRDFIEPRNRSLYGFVSAEPMVPVAASRITMRTRDVPAGTANGNANPT